jgi:hypothetical protein
MHSKFRKTSQIVLLALRFPFTTLEHKGPRLDRKVRV